MAGEDHDDALAAMWTVALQSVQRLDPDDPEEDDEDTFMIEFALESPSVSGSASVMVGGGFNETRMIGQAREILQAALKRWARVMASQPGAEQTKPTQE